MAFVFAGGQTLVTLLLLGYALVTQLFPALVLALVEPGWVTKQGAMAGIVAGVGMVAAMSFAGATPETSSTVDSFIGGLPSFLAQLNLGIVALVVNLIVMVGGERVDARSAAPRREPGASSAPSRWSGALRGSRRRGRCWRTSGAAWTRPAGPTRRRTRCPSTASGSPRRATLAAYWRDGYDWRAAEAVLNGFEQFTAERRALHRRRATARRCCCCTAGRAACGSSTG